MNGHPPRLQPALLLRESIRLGAPVQQRVLLELHARQHPAGHDAKHQEEDGGDPGHRAVHEADPIPGIL